MPAAANANSAIGTVDTGRFSDCRNAFASKKAIIVTSAATANNATSDVDHGSEATIRMMKTSDVVTQAAGSRHNRHNKSPSDSRARLLMSGRSRLVSPGTIDQRCRAEARQHVDQQHFAAFGLDDLVADDLFAGVVAALDQYARLDLRDQFDRRILRKHNHEIDRLQRRQHFRPRALVLKRALLALQPLHRCIAVQADDQPVAGAARRGQDLDVTGMQNIETAVGESDPKALLA